MIKSPEDIKKKRLPPTDRTNFSTKANLFNLRMAMMRNPGTRVRKRKLSTCLNTGILNNTARLVTPTKSIRKINPSAGDFVVFIRI